MMMDNSLPECSGTIDSDSVCFTDALNEQYCIHTSNKFIYKTTISTENDVTTNKCDAIVGSEGVTSDIIYFDKDNKIVTDATTADMAYQCTYGNTTPYTVTSCELAKGYTLIDSTNTKYIYCNGWKGEGCVVSSNALSDCTLINTDEMENGKLGMVTVNGNEKVGICATADFVLPETDTTITLELTQTSEIYGKMQDEIITLSLSSDKALIVADTTEQGKF